MKVDTAHHKKFKLTNELQPTSSETYTENFIQKSNNIKIKYKFSLWTKW